MRASLSAFRTVCSVCACLDLSVSSSSWGLRRAAVCDCGTPWTFFLPFLWKYQISLLVHGQENDQNPLVQPKLTWQKMGNIFLFLEGNICYGYSLKVHR